ncbi:MAG TPA: AMP-binding protein [Actinomycetota bacterium]|nr:AMP-binding protein [Actinomycetota bacterium]
MTEEDPSPRVLPELLPYSRAAGLPALVFHGRGEPRTLPIDVLQVGVRRRAAQLTALGVKPNAVVGLLGPNDPEWVQWAFAVWEVGAALAPISFPLRIRNRESFEGWLRHAISLTGARLVVADQRYVEFLPQHIALTWDGSTQSSAPGAVMAGDGDGPTAAPGDNALVQMTSGTTGSPKAALLSHRAVLSLAAASATAYHGERKDKTLAWLPLFHNWGVVGYLLRPMLGCWSVHIMASERFAADPAEWLRLVTAQRATMTSAPCSAWDATVRTVRRRPDGIDLSRLRLATFGAEAVNPRVVDQVIEVLGPLGLRPQALVAGYGMTETTLSIATTSPGEGIHFDEVDADELSSTGRAIPAREGHTRRVADCGFPVPGAEVRIVDENGKPLGDRCVGEIQVKSPGMMSGYRTTDPGGAEAIDEDGADRDPFVGGWLRTGDVGYLVGGRLRVTARAKETVIVGGRTFSAEEIEWAVSRLPGLGRAAAFAVAGEEHDACVVVVEMAAEADPAELLRQIRQAANDALGLTLGDVVLVAPGAIPTTDTGKVRRGPLREAYAEGHLPRGTA